MKHTPKKLAKAPKKPLVVRVVTVKRISDDKLENAAGGCMAVRTFIPY
jgi:hypothetical protein